MLRRWRKQESQEPAHLDHPTGQEREILDALKVLRDTTVREVMTPRVDVVALEVPVTEGDVMKAVRESGHSRFPVYEGDDLDQLVGVLFVKDLFRSSWKDLTNPEDTVLVPAGPDATAGRPAYAPFVPDAPVRRLRRPFLVLEGRKVLEVLAEMRKRRHAFAVVVDEHGGVEGVLTVKDLVSELVGEMPDEFDMAEEANIVRVDADRWLVAGIAPVDDVNEELGVEIPEADYVTLGGFLFERFGHIPEEGEILLYQGWELRVAEMEGRRIAKVVLRSPSATIDKEAGKPADGM